ncbi:hypothetical protein O2N63_15280 [Aliiroseovarius sp. KMU-50]|uniref:YcxB family protein n=1 Tax=Aliiroseovarius salicola TaxID=3009082 RepID=A0ABT4W4R2_9RHOB|nr:hypothetical protein [Aliiroseovarius sp. KMU-50]MDA5095450.1 hypothetical protein [Aliiroseovarius sp. KMU-50]
MSYEFTYELTDTQSLRAARIAQRIVLRYHYPIKFHLVGILFQTFIASGAVAIGYILRELIFDDTILPVWQIVISIAIGSIIIWGWQRITAVTMIRNIKHMPSMRGQMNVAVNSHGIKSCRGGKMVKAPWHTIDDFLQTKECVVLLSGGQPISIPKSIIEDEAKFVDDVTAWMKPAK